METVQYSLENIKATEIKKKKKLPRISSSLKVQAFYRSKQIDFVLGGELACLLKIIFFPLPDDVSKVPPLRRHEGPIRRINTSKRISEDCLTAKG